MSDFSKIFESQTIERQTAVINIFQFFRKEVGKMKKHILPVLEAWSSYGRGLGYPIPLRYSEN